MGKHFCGNLTSFNLTSSCGRVVITFRSDDSETANGFNASYEVIRDKREFYWLRISNGSRTEWSPIRSVIISNDKQDLKARIQPVFTSNDYRQNLTTRSPITNLL